MSGIDLLIEEHKYVIRMLGVIRKVCLNFMDNKEINYDDFEKMISDRHLLEWAEFAGNYYGTPRLPVEQQVAEGKTVLLEVELDGANQISTSCPNALRIFILPPSFSALEQRLRDRATDSSSAIDSRLKRAQIEIASAGEFDVQITNDDLETALHQLENAILL